MLLSSLARSCWSGLQEFDDYHEQHDLDQLLVSINYFRSWVSGFDLAAVGADIDDRGVQEFTHFSLLGRMLY